MKRAAVFASASVVLMWCLASTLQGQELQEGTWSGTRARLGAQGGGNVRPQRISIEIAKAPDPHSAWRPEKRQVLTVTLIAQQERFQVSDFRIEPESLSFSYREETQVTCRLERQTDGAYHGNCFGDGGGGRFRVTLSPPKGSS